MATFVRVGEKTKAIVRKQGFPTKAKTFLRLTDAKKWAKSLEAQIESGSVDSNVVLRHYTLEDSLKHYFYLFESVWRQVVKQAGVVITLSFSRVL